MKHRYDEDKYENKKEQDGLFYPVSNGGIYQREITETAEWKEEFYFVITSCTVFLWLQEENEWINK